MGEVPAWLSAYVDRVGGWLGLDHLTLLYRLKPLGKRRKGGGGGGICVPDWRYNTVRITFDVAIAPDPAGYETATHELLHASLMPIQRAVERIIDLVPPDQRKHARTLWQDGNEEAVERLGHRLTPLLRAQMEDTAPEKGSADDGEVSRVAEGGGDTSAA